MFAINFSTMATGTLNYGLFVLPMQSELGISRASFGWMQTTRRLSAGVLSFAVGSLIDRYGARVYICMAAVFIGGCLLLLSVSNHTWHFIALFGIIGMSGVAAPNGIVTSVPVAKWFSRRRGRALALSSAGLGIGGIAFLPVTQWVIEDYGWRTTWQVLAVVFVLVSVPSAALFLRRAPEDMGLRMDGDPPRRPGVPPGNAGSNRSFRRRTSVERAPGDTHRSNAETDRGFRGVRHCSGRRQFSPDTLLHRTRV